MKKVFAILAIAGLMAACNNKSENKETTMDSTAWKDSVNKAMQSMNDTTNKMMNDTTNKMMNDAKDTANGEKPKM